MPIINDENFPGLRDRITAVTHRLEGLESLIQQIELKKLALGSEVRSEGRDAWVDKEMSEACIAGLDRAICEAYEVLSNEEVCEAFRRVLGMRGSEELDDDEVRGA
jgi:hypothetical protein